MFGARDVTIDRIANRLYLAFAIVICFGGAAALVDWSQIDGLIQLSNRVANVYWPKAFEANQIIDKVNENGQSVLALMYMTDPEQMKDSVGHMKESSSELTDLLAQLNAKTTDATEKELLETIKRSGDHYDASRKKAVDLAAAGNRAQALEIFLSETLPLQKAYLESVHQFIGIQGKAMDGSMSDANHASNRAIFMIVLCAVICLLAFIAMAILLARSITRPLDRAVLIAESVSTGHLDNQIRIDCRGETAQMLGALKLMQEKLSGMMRQIYDSGLNLGQSALHIATVSKEIAEASKEQEVRSSSVSAAMIRMQNITSSVQSQAVEAADRSRHVETMARAGIENLRSNIRAMEDTTVEVQRAASEIEELEQSAQRIQNIVNSIQEIASQTNLLALNASIEAARAGEEGRGFAVVANEVRQLAVRTTASAAEVREIVDQVSGRIEQAGATMNVVVKKVDVTQEGARNAAHIIEDMAGNAVVTANANQGITDASREQNDEFKILSQSLETLEETLGNSRLKVEDTLAIGHDLRLITEGLNKTMASFTFNTEMYVESIENENRRAPRAQNRLRVVVCQNGMDFDALTTDFSMVGARLVTKRRLMENAPVAISLFMPHEDVDQYQAQEPLQLTGRVVWQKADGHSFRCGLEYAPFDDTKRLQLEQCFEYFGKNSSF
jgi:methyl-accepting chemotaxis protein